MNLLNPTNPNIKDNYDFDICIIGSGAGGAISAAKLSNKGLNIVVLEQGEYVDKNDFDQNERKLITKMYNRSAGLATDDMSIRILQGKVFGGSTTINWMTSLRTPEYVLNQWVDEYGLNEYNPKDMSKHFDEIEKRLNVHKIKDEDHSPGNRIILEGGRKLKLHTEVILNNSKNCIGCGTCGLGCPYDAKQDMRLTYLQDALNNGITIFTETRAEKIDYKSKNSQIIAATLLGKNSNAIDRTIKFHVKRTIVSGSAISTPLLLQKSNLTKGGNVGKYLQLHPVTGVTGVFDKIIDPVYGIPQSAVIHHVNEDGYGWWLESPDLEPFLMGVNFPTIGKVRREKMQLMRNTGVIIVLVRDGANKKSNGEVRWRKGFNYQSGSFSLKPLPSIRYRLSKIDHENMMKGIEAAIKVQFSAGAHQVFTLHSKFILLESEKDIEKIKPLKSGPNQMTLFSAHPMGTARMSRRKEISVVNERMEMHNYPGIFVMDGSTLPTALGVNPMITILGCVSRAIEIGNLNMD